MKWYFPFKVLAIITGALVITIAFMFIHELGHILALYCIGINETKLIINNDVSMCVYHDSVKNVTQRRFVKVAGSGFAIIVGFILYGHACKVRSNTFFLGTALSISINLMYWALSPLFGKGDAWDFIQTYDSFNPYWIVIPFIISLFGFWIMNAYVWYYRFYEFYYPTTYKYRG